MVGLGMLMIVAWCVGAVATWRGALWSSRLFLRMALVDGAGWAGRDSGRLVHDGNRPPTMDRLWLDANGGCRIRTRRVPVGFTLAHIRRRVLDGVRRGHSLYVAIDSQGPRSAGRRQCRQSGGRASDANRCGRYRPRRMRSHAICHAEEHRYGHRPAADLGDHHLVRHHDVCRHGRLRSGIRDSVSVLSRQGRPRRDDEHGRTSMGWQRNLAGARRCGTACCFSARIFDDSERVLPAVDPDAGGIDFPWRGVRVPLQGARHERHWSGTRLSPAVPSSPRFSRESHWVPISRRPGERTAPMPAVPSTGSRRSPCSPGPAWSWRTHCSAARGSS